MTVPIAPVLCVVAAILTGLLYPAGQVAWRVRNEQKQFELVPRHDTCSVLNDPLLQGCEKGVVHYPTGQVFFACAIDTSVREKWFPAVMEFDPEAALNPKGGISSKVTRLELQDFPPTFHPHGLSIVPSPDDPNQLLIAAVNHGASGSSVEIFEHTLQTTTARHLETFRNDKLLPAPNDVLLLDRHSFFATNDRSNVRSKLWTAVERSGWVKGGHIVYKGKDGNAKVVADKVEYPNGIAASVDQKHIYVGDNSRAQVLVYERRGTNRLRLVDTIPIPHAADNLSVEPSTGNIYVTGVNQFFSCLVAFLMDGPTVCPGAVTKITNNTDHDLFFGKKYKTSIVFTDDGHRIPVMTIAGVVPDLKKSFVAGLSGGVVVCKTAW
ncbi:hypothetical protein DFJ77DRAFT_149220 [Powellomyces hirtus]|nr:hypothetical protein DFJ77DRAFT_149220 [Powellomyces hirtus]